MLNYIKAAETSEYTLFTNGGQHGTSAWANMELRCFGINITRSSKETSETLSVVVLESDILGSSVNGRNPLALKNDELRFWLKCRDDPAKGLRTKAQLVKR